MSILFGVIYGQGAGDAIDFDGSNDYISITDDASLTSTSVITPTSATSRRGEARRLYLRSQHIRRMEQAGAGDSRDASREDRFQRDVGAFVVLVLTLRRTGAGAADDGATSSACCHNDQFVVASEYLCAGATVRRRRGLRRE